MGGGKRELVRAASPRLMPTAKPFRPTGALRGALADLQAIDLEPRPGSGQDYP
jgi:hypothetical protein